MKYKKYYLLIVFLVLILLAFTLKSFNTKKEIQTNIHIEKKETVYQPGKEIESALSKFDSLLTINLKESGTVGAAAVISYKGEIVYLNCYGVRKKGEKSPVNQHTVFRLASVSKSITGVLAGILNEEKIVKLDDKVIKYIPEFELKDETSTQNITIRHLLSHTSGLIPHAYDLMVEDHVELEKIIEKLKEVDIVAPPGELYGYQNVMYSIYDPIVEAKTQKSFSALLSEKVFIPFGMNDATTGFEAFNKNTNKAFPHANKGNNKFAPIRLNNRYYNTMPAAGVNASISDIGAFLANLTDTQSQVLSNQAHKTIFSPQVVSPLKRTYFSSWGKVDSKEYGIGWRIVQYNNRKVAYHGGFVNGYKSEIAYCEDENIGIAILSNSPSNLTSKNIPAFLNLIFEQKDTLASNNKNLEKSDNKS